MNPNIGTPQQHNVNELSYFHSNPRIGDTEAIAASLRSNGAYKPIVVNKGTHTGRPNEVLAGNHTLKAHQLLVEQGETQYETIATWVVDVTNEQANRIVLADNRTADLGSYDNENLLLLLQEIGDDLDGTGYAAEDKDMLKDLLDEPATLDELEEEFGTLDDDDLWVTVRFRIPPIVNDQWKDWARAYDSEEEAFEALLDKGSDYGQA